MQGLPTPAQEIASEAMVEPHVEQNPRVAAIGGLEQGARRDHFGMTVGIDVDGAMQADTVDSPFGQAQRLGRSVHEIAKHAAQLHQLVVAREQGMRKMVHRRGTARPVAWAVIIPVMNILALPADPDSFPDQAASFALNGPAGKLEVISDVAERPGARRGTAIVCHPHPLQGGTMHNKVVTMVERSLRESGLDTLRFNFRGTGESEGSYDDGNGEGDDLAAVAQWVRRLRPDDALWLAGFSFGSYVSIRNAVRLHADALISIAPPAGRWPFDTVELPTCPWLVVQGEDDEIVDPQAVFDWIDAMEHPPELVRMPETSHFFHRRLMDLRGAIKHSIRDWLPPQRS